MQKKERDFYIFKKKCLLILLYLYYINNVDYKNIVIRSFGFHFDPTCNFKAIVHSKKMHVHKYVVHIFNSIRGVNLEELDVMGNVNFIKVNDIKNIDPFTPASSLNVYFDETNFIAIGYIEGKFFTYQLIQDKKNYFKDEILYYLNNDPSNLNKNESAKNFLLFLLRFFTYKLNTDLVMGAGINLDYGAKDWKHLIEALNMEFYKNDVQSIAEIQHFVGNELFVNGKVFKTSGFDTYKSLNKELYLFEEAKSFNDSNSTLYKCVDYLEKHPYTNVITYNYDTNLEYLLKKRGIKYTSVYDENSFVNKEALTTIFHVHGLLPYDKYKESKYINSLIFNESEYFYLYNNPYSWNISKQMHDFTFNTCLFIGVSLTDPNMKRLLEASANPLKFNFIFMKKEEGFKESTYRSVTNYFFSYDLITIWIDKYEEIGLWLSLI